MSGFFIPTQSGQQGPYSLEQVQELVNTGKLPLSLHVIAEVNGEKVSVHDLIDESWTPSLPATPPDADGVRESAVPADPGLAPVELDAPEADEPAPAPARPASRAGGAFAKSRARRAPPTRGPVASRGRSRGRPGAGAGQRAGRGGFMDFEEANQEHDLPPPKRSRTPIVVGVIVGVLIITIAIFALWPVLTGGGGIQGTWLMTDLAAGTEGRLVISAKDLQLRSITAGESQTLLTGRYVERQGDGGRTELRIVSDGGRVEIWMVKLAGSKLSVEDENGGRYEFRRQ